MKFFKTLYVFFFAFTFFSCNSKVNLEPQDKRPVKSIEVGDATEAALVQQEMDIEIKYVAGNTLYFYADNQNTISELEKIGYKVREQDPLQTSFKMVKLMSKNKVLLSTEKNETIQKELQEYRIKVLLREKGYWAIHGTLESLSMLKEMGYKFENLEIEIRPRNIKIIVPAWEDIQKVNEANVDIYSYGSQDEGYVIYGGAYDYQIDALEAAGYKVEIEI